MRTEQARQRRSRAILIAGEVLVLGQDNSHERRIGALSPNCGQRSSSPIDTAISFNPDERDGYALSFQFHPFLSTLKKLLIGLALLSAACTHDSLIAPSETSLTGTWNLKTINGAPLPFVVSQFGGKKVEVITDVLTIKAPNTFTEVSNVQTTQNGQTTTDNIPDSGTYTFDSLIITFRFNSNGSTGLATLTDKTLTIETGAISFVYKKQ